LTVEHRRTLAQPITLAIVMPRRAVTKEGGARG
jgi:hypothetical protein